MDVVGAEVRLVRVAGCPFAVILVGGVGGDGDVALFGEALRVPAGDLFLGIAVGVRDGIAGYEPAGS
ncbi:hypothetical protein [Rothia uropygialis]|uniref:hypothetical protein n=1 Tax=Kocuria sp. 36 TaxID=1415402 RepID=UPI0019311543|nr:hypothetical protein [Kocuria sp. 36]